MNPQSFFQAGKQPFSKGRSKEKMSSISLETADRLFTAANFSLLVSLVIGVIATGVVVWMGKIREEYAAERLGKNEALTALANAGAASANEKAAAANESAERVKESAVKLELRVQELKKENLSMEAALSPRMFLDQSGATETLRQFAGMRVYIEYLSGDLEINRFARMIRTPLAGADWNCSLTTNSHEIQFRDGVTVILGSGPLDPRSPVGQQAMSTPAFSSEVFATIPAETKLIMEKARYDMRARSIADNAAKALVSVLTSRGIKAGTHAGDDAFHSGSIVVRVGVKPSPANERMMKEIMEEFEANKNAASSKTTEPRSE